MKKVISMRNSRTQAFKIVKASFAVDPSTKYEKPRQDVGVFYCLMILIAL